VTERGLGQLLKEPLVYLGKEDWDLVFGATIKARLSFFAMLLIVLNPSNVIMSQTRKIAWTSKS
jgi:hypothetical protein